MATGNGSQSSIRIPFLLLCAAIFASFLASSGPIQWMDNGVFMADASLGHYFSESLGPLDHPLYHFVSTGTFDLFGPLILSLLNSILLIPLAWVIYRLGLSVGASARQALLAATATILSHSVFWVSTKVEVYILHSLLVLMAYWVQLDRRSSLGDFSKLFIIGTLTGLGAAIHQLTFVVLLPLYIQLLYQHKTRILITVPGFAAGFAVAWPAVAHDLQGGMNIIEVFHRYLTGSAVKSDQPNWEGSLLRFDDMWHEKNSVIIVLLSLIGPQLLGLLLFPKDNRLRLLWCAATLNFVFAVSYNVTDRFTFFLPGVAMLSIIGVIKLQALLPENLTGKALTNLSVVASPMLILLAYSLYATGVLSLPTHKEPLPFRNDIHYFMAPYLPDHSAEQFARTYEQTVPEGALIIADWTPMGALRSAQAIGALQGRTLEMCDEVADISVYLEGSGAFLARTSYCGMIGDKYALESSAVGYALHGK
ncbi:protein O-mannosyl-transferase family [Pseudomonas sp. DWP3-1-2]|uniref:protein O-mannosyl-transferase family n=1 Tax=Pseudomonas sp. DWP3-1-2 TaxID=2804645 RepID=UPI003CF916CC